MKYSSQGMCAVFCHYNAKKTPLNLVCIQLPIFVSFPNARLYPNPLSRQAGVIE